MYAAIDYGTARIGVAVANESVRIAHPRPIVAVSSDEEGIAALAFLFRQEHVTHVVIGLPVAANGNETIVTERVKAFANRLSAVADVQVIFADERMSTQQAEKAGIAKDRADSAAASLLLQTALDAGTLPRT